jgi:hypothetical protein
MHDSAKALAVAGDLRQDPGFLAYLEARTELLRLARFIQLKPEVELYEAFYQSTYFPTLERL